MRQSALPWLSMITLLAAGHAQAGNRVTTEARDTYVGDAGCPHLFANVENAERFWVHTVNRNNPRLPRPFRKGVVWANDQVGSIHFIDNAVSPSGSDLVNFDRQGNQDAFAFFSGHGGCEGRTGQACTTDAECTNPPAGSRPWGLCIRNTMTQGLCQYPAGREIVGDRNCGAANTFGQVFFGESPQSGGFAGAGTDGGVNFVVLDISCGAQPDMYWDNYGQVAAGVHSIATIMPTHPDSDTSSTRFRGRDFAFPFHFGGNNVVTEDWLNAMNDISSGRSCPFGGGRHGISGCGAHLTMSFDSDEARALWSRDSEKWSHITNDNNDAVGANWVAWKYQCNYDCNAISWRMNGALSAQAEEELRLQTVQTRSLRPTRLQPREGKAFRLGGPPERLQLAAAAKRDLSPDGTLVVSDAQGLFVSRPNGWAFSRADADSPVAQARPYSDRASVHNARVLAHFRKLGLPANEIGGIHVTTRMSGSGPAFATSDQSQDRFDGYTSHVERVVGGVRVVGSFAWARFNEHDEVVEQGVYWPRIDKRVVQQAVRFSAKVAGRAQRDAFLKQALPNQTLDAPSDESEVVIVHTNAGETAPFQASAVYEVAPARAAKGRVHYFDISGKEAPILP